MRKDGMSEDEDKEPERNIHIENVSVLRICESNCMRNM